jgi:hypothetical protein
MSFGRERRRAAPDERARRLREDRERERQRALRQQQRAQQVRELTHDFADAPEQVGLWLRELAEREALGPDEERGLLDEVARSGGRELAERALGAVPTRGGAWVRDADARRRALTAELLAELAPRLGLRPDELDVRVDAEARRRTEAGGARGVMSDGIVWLHPDRYDPSRPDGRSLLGHEVAHVAQRRVTGPGGESFGRSAVAGGPTLRRAESEAAAIAGAFAARGGVPQVAATLPAAAVAFEGPPQEGPRGAPGPNGPDGPGKPQMTEAEAAEELRKIQTRAAQAPKPEKPTEAGKPPEPPASAAKRDGVAAAGAAEPAPKQASAPEAGGDAAAGALAALAAGGRSQLPGMGELSTSLLARYGGEKAWHDNWKTQGSPTGMPAADRAALVGSALGAGGVQGLTNAASAMLIDTLLNKATKNIPYASGFIAIGQLAMDPKGWVQGQQAAIWDKGLAGGARKLFGADSDWIDRIEGVVDILDGLNNVVGLLSTICMIVGAAGFVIGLFFPPLLPFVALAVKWGLLLGEINTFVGIAITGLRMITLAARAIQIAASDADPETQLKRAEKLRENTAQWTQGYAQRKANKARQTYQQRKAQAKAAGASGGDAQPAGPAAGGKQGAPAAGAAGGKAAAGVPTQQVQQNQTRRQRIQQRLEQLGGALGGGDLATQRETVGKAQESAGNLQRHIRENEGSARVDAIRKDATTADALSEGSYRRLDAHYAKKESPAQHAAAQQRLQQAQDDHDAALTARQTLDQEVARAERKVQEAAERVAATRRHVEASAKGESGRQLDAQRNVIGDAEARVPLIERQVRLKEGQVHARQREIEVLEGAARDLAAKGPEYRQSAADLRLRALNHRQVLVTEQSKLDKARLHLDGARRTVEIERDYLKGLQEAQQSPLRKAEQELAGAQGERDRLGAAQTTAGGQVTAESARLAAARAGADRTRRAMEEAQLAAAGSGQAKAVGGDSWAALQDTLGGFGPGRAHENLDGGQVPAAGYGHQGTGGVTGAGTGVLTADPTGTDSGVLKTLASPNAALQSRITGALDGSFGAATADTDAGAPQAGERRRQAIAAAQTSMETSFSSMVAGLPTPPSEQEGALEAARGRHQKTDEELRQVRFQLATITELRPGMKADESALDALRKLSAANQAAIAQQEGDIGQKEQKQGEVKSKVEEQGAKSADAKAKQQARADRTTAFVGKFLQLMGMVPSRVVSNAGPGSSGVRKLQQGVEGVGSGSDSGKQKADHAKAGVGQMGAATAAAKQGTAEGKKQLDALDAEWQGDRKAVGTGLDFLAQSERSGTAREKQLEQALKAEQAAYVAAVSAMDGWAGEHHALRTTGQAGVEEQLTSIEKLLDEHEAALAAKKKQAAP